MQKAPFRLRAEPKAKRSHFLQLNWVFDELFIRPEVRNELQRAKISGICFLEPILHKEDRPSDTIIQMKINSVLPVGLDKTGLNSVTCRPNNEESSSIHEVETKNWSTPYCNRVKYHFMRRGPYKFDKQIFNSMPDVLKSHEWFGSGAGADRLIIVSQRFRELVSNMKWRGIDFEPIILL